MVITPEVKAEISRKIDGFYRLATKVPATASL